jgi:hypothetical protein
MWDECGMEVLTGNVGCSHPLREREVVAARQASGTEENGRDDGNTVGAAIGVNVGRVHSGIEESSLNWLRSQRT